MWLHSSHQRKSCAVVRSHGKCHSSLEPLGAPRPECNENCKSLEDLLILARRLGTESQNLTIHIAESVGKPVKGNTSTRTQTDWRPVGSPTSSPSGRGVTFKPRHYLAIALKQSTNAPWRRVRCNRYCVTKFGGVDEHPTHRNEQSCPASNGVTGRKTPDVAAD